MERVMSKFKGGRDGADRAVKGRAGSMGGEGEY